MEYSYSCSVLSLRSLLFTISAVKAGLYFDGAVFRNYGLTIVLLGVVPCVVEAVAVSMMVKLLFRFSYTLSFTLGYTVKNFVVNLRRICR